MFIKVSTSGGHRYARLVESFRNEDGQPRQRTVATLGRIDENGGQLDALLGGLLRAKGRPSSDADVPQVRFESALALGDVWTPRVRHFRRISRFFRPDGLIQIKHLHALMVSFFRFRVVPILL